MKQKHHRLWAILLLLLLALLTACNGSSNTPPDPGTPEPPPLNGVYVSPKGTLTFNGDGESVTMELSEMLADVTGLPMGKSEGTYCFLFHHGLWRYDTAETLRLTVGDRSCDLMNIVGETGEDRISVLSPLGDDTSLQFIRQAD